MANRLTPRNSTGKPIYGGICQNSPRRVCESPHEYNALQALALCRDIEDIDTQTEIPLATSSKAAVNFYPDIKICTSTGKKLLVEVKTTKHVGKLEPSEWISRRQASALAGYDNYILILDSHIAASPIHTIAKHVTTKRRNVPDKLLCEQVNSALNEHQPMLASRLACELQVGINQILGALFHGILACDKHRTEVDELTVSLPYQPFPPLSYEDFLPTTWSRSFFKQLVVDGRIPVELLPDPPPRRCNGRDPFGFKL